MMDFLIFFFFQFPPNILDDKDIAFKCIEKSGMTFKYFSKRLKSDRDLALALLKKCPSEYLEIIGEIGHEIRYLPLNQMAPYVEAIILKDDLESNFVSEKKENRKHKL